MMDPTDTLEIPRSLMANVWKLVAGLVLLAVGLGLALDGTPALGIVLFGIPGLLLAGSNARLLVQRPPQLRATRAGVSFAGGALIAWSEIDGIYEAGTPIERYGYKVRTQAIRFAFRRRRTVLRLPSTLWLTTMMVGDVKISTHAAPERPEVLVIRLDALRHGASDADAPAAAESRGIPTARVIQRSRPSSTTRR